MSVQSERGERLAASLPERYEFRKLIGKGGAAYVALANDRDRGHLVAVKILRPEIATVVGETRFRREIEILSHLDHPAILPLLDYGSVNEALLYFTMPFVEGTTLQMRLREAGPLAIRDAVSIAEDVASALDYAHSRGIIHRDIKPANILVSDGRVIVADFGIARAMAVDSAEQITVSGVSIGTPEYMSPEQVEAMRELDARCDVYALGCVTYEMLAGEPPFTGPTELAIFSRHVNEPPKSIRMLRPEVPAGVDAAIIKALQKSRAARFYTAGGYAKALVMGLTQ
ncbi:MAG TPA: serine/threonine-protein kinase [Gemmatimonadaceae bacterium]|nr:serine/threonine-protein kinase [Gemmatimonadaceae bacterium]